MPRDFPVLNKSTVSTPLLLSGIWKREGWESRQIHRF